RPHRREIAPPRGERAQVSVPRPRVLAGEGAQARDALGEAPRMRIEHRVRTKRGDHASAPPRRADRPMVLERIVRPLRGGEGLDVESLEEGAGAKLWPLEALGDSIVNAIRRL